MIPGCHRDSQSNAKSPESCNVCHGKFTALAIDKPSWAPPVALNNDSLTTSAGVGAHQKHLATGTVGKIVKCEECHTIPATLNAAGHLNAQPFRAEVVFQDTLSKLITGEGANTPSPSFGTGAFTCSNTYCHGNWKLNRSREPGAYSIVPGIPSSLAYTDSSFVYVDSVMVGNNHTPAWTGTATCGSCHGLPPTGHKIPWPGAKCSDCHEVVNSSLQIINKAKHVNGKVNVFGREYPMR